MIHREGTVFFELPSASGQRVLHPARVTEAATDKYVAKLVSPDVMFEVEQLVMVYFHSDRHFMKQPVQIESVNAKDSLPVVEFVLTGEAVSAENRSFYRVSAVMADIVIDLENETGCQLLDVSLMGCSVMAKGKYQLGQTVRIRLYHKNRTFDGQGCIQGVRDLGGERTRYGLIGILNETGDASIKKGLHELTMSLERLQLQRLSCAR